MPSGTPKETLEEMSRGRNLLFAVGISAYQHFAKLPNARKDVEDVAAVLTENYGFEQPLRLLCDADANRDAIIDELENLAKKVTPDDRLIIYYSGHGVADGARGFWVPVNAEQNRKATYINNVEIRDIIQHIQARHILLISDSCFSATLLVRDGGDPLNSVFADWVRAPSRYAFISGKGVVSDGRAGQNSPFAAHLLKYLRENDEPALNIALLADRVTKGVRWNYPQQAELNPLYQSGHEGGQFVFFRQARESAAGSCYKRR